MTYVIFAIVAAALYGISHITGLTYNTVNILVYYLIIPLSWCIMGDKIIHWRKPWLTISWTIIWLIIFILTFGYFQAWCDWAFYKSVDFLFWFKALNWNYYVASVYICVWLPLIIYALLSILLIWRHNRKHCLRWTMDAIGIIIILWSAWWAMMSFAVRLEPLNERQELAFTLSPKECLEIQQATKGMTEKQIVNYAIKYTCDKLDFGHNTISIVPNGNFSTVHSEICAAVANQAFEYNNINAQAHHDVGTIKLFGIDLCRLASKHGYNFLASHDFVTIKTGDKSYSIDPTVKNILGYDLRTNTKSE